MKKILLIHEASGGCGKHVLDLAEYLDKSKFDITVIYGEERADNSYLERKKQIDKRVRFISLKNFVRDVNPRKDLLCFYELNKIIKKSKPDIVHCHSSKAGVLGRIAAKKNAVTKIIYTPHAYAFQAPEVNEINKYIYIIVERLLSKYTTSCTINVSEGERREAIKNKIDKPEKFYVIYNGLPSYKKVNKEQIKDDLRISKDIQIVGTTARIAPQKDPYTFIKIAEEVAKKKKKVIFLYVGDGPLKEDVEIMIKKDNLQNNVRLLGYRTDCDDLIQIFDTYLLTSVYEGLPYSLIEAIRAGVPVVATNVTGNNEVIINGENGVLFEKGDYVEGADAVIKVLNGLIDQEKIRKSFQKFKIETMIKAITDIYLK